MQCMKKPHVIYRIFLCITHVIVKCPSKISIRLDYFIYSIYSSETKKKKHEH